MGIIQGAIVWGVIALGGNCPGGNCPGDSCPEGNCPEAIVLEPFNTVEENKKAYFEKTEHYMNW